MRKYLPHASLLLAIIIIFNLPTILTVIIEFIFLGAIPGTTKSIPFWIMLPAMATLGVAIVYWISRQPLFIGDLEYQEKVARQLARKRIAKKVAEQRALQPAPRVVTKRPTQSLVRAARTTR